MISIEKKFFVVTGKIDLLSELESETKSEDFTKTELYAFLRAEKKFESVATLTAQVLEDIERAKDV